VTSLERSATGKLFHATGPLRAKLLSQEVVRVRGTDSMQQCKYYHTATPIQPPLFQDNLGEPVTAKVKPVWIKMRQEMMGFKDGSGISGTIHMQTICTSPRQITMPTPHHSIFMAGCSS